MLETKPKKYNFTSYLFVGDVGAQKQKSLRGFRLEPVLYSMISVNYDWRLQVEWKVWLAFGEVKEE